MICYFRKGLKPSIKVEMEQQDREPMNFEEMVQKAVNAEVKAGLKSSTMVRDSDIRCPKGHRPSNSTISKVQTQRTTVEESKPEESRPKELKLAEGKNPALLRSESTEPGKTSRTDKKREYLKKKRDRQNNTLATRDNANAIEVGEKKKQDNQGDGRCYNCQKTGHFSKNYPESLKN